MDSQPNTQPPNRRSRIYRAAVPASLAWCFLVSFLIAAEPPWWSNTAQAITIAVTLALVLVLVATAHGAS